MATSSGTAQSGLTLRDELPYYQDLPKTVDIFEGCPQQLLLATVDDYDMLFWIAPYVLEGRTPGGFLAQDTSTLGYLLVMAPKKGRGKMNDTDFICRGFTPADYLKTRDLTVDARKDRVIWRIKDTEFIARPPYWEIRGSDGDIAYDLKVTGNAPTSWYVGDFKDILKTGVACFNQFTTVTGSISVKGKTYKITKGYGCHEHPVLARPVDESFKKEQFWFIGGSEEVQFLHFGWGVTERRARLLVKGKYLTYDSGVRMEVLEWWQDPRSLARVPCKFHINMCSPDGIFDVHAVASGRANRIWCLRNGYVLDVWNVGTVNGVFLYPNGRSIPIKDMLFTVTYMKNIWP